MGGQDKLGARHAVLVQEGYKIQEYGVVVENLYGQIEIPASLIVLVRHRAIGNDDFFDLSYGGGLASDSVIAKATGQDSKSGLHLVFRPRFFEGRLGPGQHHVLVHADKGDLGIKRSYLIEHHSGGIRNGKKYKAASPGGISMGVLGPDQYDAQLDFDVGKKYACLGLGTAGVVLMDEDTDMVAVARNRSWPWSA